MDAINPIDSGVAATAGAALATAVINNTQHVAVDPADALTKVIIPIIVGIITPLIHTAIKRAYKYFSGDE